MSDAWQELLVIQLSRRCGLPVGTVVSLSGTVKPIYSSVLLDIGGGFVSEDSPTPSLSNIPLRWMLREIVKSNCGVLFCNDSLDRLGIPEDVVPRNSGESSPESQYRASLEEGSIQAHGTPESVCTTLRDATVSVTSKGADEVDAMAELHNELRMNPIWWLLQWPLWKRKDWWYVVHGMALWFRN